ncbi:MAG: hypothetical protein ABJA60_11545, partial [Nitrosospira sp.]
VSVFEYLMLCYEVHFYRHDGTLGMRVLTAAASENGALFTMRKMRCAEFSAPKVFRGLNRPKAGPPAVILQLVDHSEAATLDFEAVAECQAAVQGDEGRLATLNRYRRKAPPIHTSRALIQRSAS